MNELMVAETGMSKDQLELIKNTVAKNATNDELKLFLYRCKQMGLDPLKPGQIYFIKYNNSAGTIVVGLDGFRAKAEASGRHAGTKRGIIKDEKGKALGAWCEVYRSDWREPAREEVSLEEYNTGKGQWAKMPETMLKKVAEVAALRMAFPDILGGIYSQEEMDQAEPKEKRVLGAQISQEKWESHKEDVKDLGQLASEMSEEKKKPLEPNLASSDLIPEEVRPVNKAQEIEISNEQAVTLKNLGAAKGYDVSAMNYVVRQVTGQDKWGKIKVSQLEEIRKYLK